MVGNIEIDLYENNRSDIHLSSNFNYKILEYDVSYKSSNNNVFPLDIFKQYWEILTNE